MKFRLTSRNHLIAGIAQAQSVREPVLYIEHMTIDEIKLQLTVSMSSGADSTILRFMQMFQSGPQTVISAGLLAASC